MESWQKTYDKGFSINTSNESKILSLGNEFIQKKCRALDMGCGNGRNSIYLAELGCSVDAIDLVDLDFVKNLSDNIKNKINFEKKPIKDINMRDGEYGVILIARVIQYLDQNSLSELFSQCRKGLNKNGVLFISYVSSGGIVLSKKYNVERYDYTIDFIKNILEENGLRAVKVFSGSTHSKYVSYSVPMTSYDLIVKSID
jgi:2-polyprenyl-3-methyl-5-hydroxy-6-metoxy-1,4-benzoquinol methylase